MKKILISQSNYIPWKGFLDSIRAVDEYVLFDDVQFTRRDWRNRNRIKTPRGVQWLTIPVEVKGKFHQNISEVTVADEDWTRAHWDTIRQNYKNAPHFSDYAPTFEAAYQEAQSMAHLSNINELFLTRLCEAFSINTPFRRSSEFTLAADKTERLVSICEQAGATDYYTGPSARAYIDIDQFAERGIRVHYFDFSAYPEYDQPHPPFEHAVTALDLLFAAGPDAPRYLKDLTIDAQCPEIAAPGSAN